MGRHICLAGLRAGYQVTSLSRSGIPVQIPPGSASSMQQVNWIQADVFKPDSYAKYLASADAVVHSMGVIFPSEAYKSLINNGLSLYSLYNLLSNASTGSNPLQQNQNLYFRVNRDSAVSLAENFANAFKSDKSVARKPFVYISADAWNPLLPSDYIESKRQAENIISTRIEGLRHVFVRPGFMFDARDQQGLRHLVKKGLDATSWVGKLAGIKCISQSAALPVQVVAAAVVEALEDSSINGVVSLNALRTFAESI